ncbi:transcription termination factor MTERF15, mitochondrial-like [Cicer arietinum]|uniref:Uncharacterized protein LOC101493784 n=2 Tax=Cicer arietinum TaxID=3827 RepID=A0A1S2XHQ2_CICAR|nr:uncharacterized protein LOC101493784 [Cicer arietinum]XP_004516711.1 uncharacterized protein LOC101498737 [Cicer arietinum]XP_027187098.1 uncharacterized protein LOC101498737 [Cicer arietinum]
MFNFNSWRHKSLLYFKIVTFSPISQNPLPLSLYFCTNTSHSTSFAVSYLIHNFGFSPLFANKLCSTYSVKFKTNQNPDLVLTFFRNHGFSDSQLRDTIAKAPWLLTCDPIKRVLPKFQFFLSKGASNSDIVNLVSMNPMVLCSSLENQIVPTYELVYRFLKSHKDTIACVNHNSTFFGDRRVASNIRLLTENGVADSNIARMLKTHCRTLQTRDMLKLVEELKDLGFNPSKATFGVALNAKTTVPEARWKEKVDTLKKWGWSDEDVLVAFRTQPYCMLVSIDKINLVMNFWINQLGWDAMALVKGSSVFLLSLEKRIIPRAQVVQYLLKKGLRKKTASMIYPFVMSDKLFLDMFIKRFEESSYLLKLYEEKLNLAYTTDKTCLS